MDDVVNAQKVGETKSLTQLLCRMSNYHSMRPKRNSKRHDPPPVTGSLRVSGAHPLVSPSVTGQRPRELSLRPAGPQEGRHLVPLPGRHSEGSPRLRPRPQVTAGSWTRGLTASHSKSFRHNGDARLAGPRRAGSRGRGEGS